jgi:mono/diheme cytochrome c family protein
MRSVLVAALLGLILAGCSAGPNQTNVELIQDMMDQKNLKSQDYDEFRKMPSNMMPPKGAIPRGHTPYQFAGKPLDAEAKLVNPLSGAEFEKSLVEGKAKYQVYCSMCHGQTGLGDGTVAQYMPLKPPSLVSDKVRNFRDGRIYHIITDGQGVMGNYATQIHKEEHRWAIVNYIRSLQKN